MLRYWTFWNFSWYMGFELKILQLNGPLIISIINTSLIGGFMTYIYPKRIVFRFRDKKYELPYYQVVLLDIVFHQIPLVRIITLKNKIISNTNKKCGLYTIIPLYFWYNLNKFRNINQDKIYNIKMKNLLLGSAIITSTFGFLVHKQNMNLCIKKYI